MLVSQGRVLQIKSIPVNDFSTIKKLHILMWQNEREYFIGIKFTVKIMFSNMSKLCTITSQQYPTLITREYKIL